MLQAYPDGVYAQKARAKLAELQAQQDVASRQPPPQSPSTLPAARLHENYDAPGNDRGRWLPNVSLDDCERRCREDAGCVGFTYNRRKSVCIPKNAIGSLVPAVDAAVTGVLSDRTGPAQVALGVRIRRYENKDAPGGDDGGWLRNVSSEEECQRACLAESHCVAYTYNIKRSVCIRKSKILELTAAPETAVTGILTDRMALPIEVRDAPPSFPTLRRYEGMDAPGADRGPWRRNITSAACEAICVSDRDCAGYTYNRKRSVCILKDSIGGLAPSRDPAVTVVINRSN